MPNTEEIESSNNKRSSNVLLGIDNYTRCRGC